MGMSMKKTLSALALAVIALAAYLLLWPVPVEPVAFSVAPLPGYAGPHAPNQRLARLQYIDLKGERGAEHVAIGPDGKLYTAVASGKILRMNADGSGLEVFAQPGGRILGLAFDAAGHIIGADTERGLVSVAPDGKTTTVLADTVDGDPIRFADAVVVARNGRIYFAVPDSHRPLRPALRSGQYHCQANARTSRAVRTFRLQPGADTGSACPANAPAMLSEPLLRASLEADAPRVSLLAGSAPRAIRSRTDLTLSTMTANCSKPRPRSSSSDREMRLVRNISSMADRSPSRTAALKSVCAARVARFCSRC